MARRSLKSAAESLETLGYDPIEALVEIARNRNQLADIRLKAAIALLPYAYAQVASSVNVNLTDNTGVMRVPVAASEEEWQREAIGFSNRVGVEDAEIIELRKPH